MIVAYAMVAIKIKIVLVHENDPRKGGCPANNSECWLPFSLFQSILFFH